jgi:hypothetical protein
MNIAYSKYIKYRHKYLDLLKKNNQLYGGTTYPTFATLSGEKINYLTIIDGIDLSDLTIEDVKKRIAIIKNIEFWFLIRILDDTYDLDDNIKIIDKRGNFDVVITRIDETEEELFNEMSFYGKDNWDIVLTNYFDNYRRGFTNYPLSDQLCNNKSFILLLFKIRCSFDLRLLYNTISDNLKYDESFFLEIVKLEGRWIQFLYNKKMIISNVNERNIILAAVRQNGYSLEYVDEQFKNDKEIVLTAIRQTGNALQYASSSLRANRNIVLNAVNQNGLAIQYAINFQDDDGVMIEAINQNGYALEYASSRIKGIRDVVLSAIRFDGTPLRFATDEIKDTRIVVLQALSTNPFALSYVSPRLKDDENVVLTAIKINKGALMYASPRLRELYK